MGTRAGDDTNQKGQSILDTLTSMAAPRKLIKKTLAGRQEIEMTNETEKMLRAAYHYMQGFAKRKKAEEVIANRTKELAQLYQKLPAELKQSLKSKLDDGEQESRVGESNNSENNKQSGNRSGNVNVASDSSGGNIDASENEGKKSTGSSSAGSSSGESEAGTVPKLEEPSKAQDEKTSQSNPPVGNLSTAEVDMDRFLSEKGGAEGAAAYFKTRKDLALLTEKYTKLVEQDQKISIKDMDMLLRSLGAPHSTKALEQMLWEVIDDDKLLVTWDNFQLTYHRNCTLDPNEPHVEPCSFFNILEFITFDVTHTGCIVEDDVMEVLFGRFGAGKLEDEMKFIFGRNLRSAGGTGSMTLTEYLKAVMPRAGKRALFSIHP